ncbi:flagellar L-ring protein precursor FlgH [Roseibium hamelinense]|uniref:Flagellar L-ring protein n=1 Tax=Roseibium hamelinense TaxID=150831 RepID=A0A562T9W4_9HYPH|nr:flagellar basal body L-ring protein FlgH [Roseibium hamelinense]MTI45254.1 flagellar basal body L-ring protein FlgH [Roseibium hamelinense]TWI90382.1 flagellar L-ring protein precursor FlgH [Roseibium hamelinense]
MFWNKHKSLAAGVALATLVGACGTADRLADVGKQPSLNAIQDPTTQPGYRPIQMPMPEPIKAHYNPNSLWRSGNRAFFEDQRAKQVGDILTVVVTITDEAEIDNKTERSRSDTSSTGAGGALGNAIDTIFLPAGSSASALATVNSDMDFEGEGSVEREETLRTNIAAVVLQVLPNGNMVIEGRQEVRVNFEVRELIVAGIVRPEDITSDNRIASEKIAEARIGYGGRGQITDVQQPRYGSQVMDILLPF